MTTTSSTLRTRTTPVLVIGAGGAGLRAAIAAHDAGAEVVLVSKRRSQDAHTVLAAGGINAALGSRDPEDTPAWHFADTYDEGYGLGDPAMVETLVEDAPRAVKELAEWGCQFARTEDGALDQRFFGAHRYRRTCFAGDWTGRAIVETLRAQVMARGITVLDDHYVSDLLVTDGTCYGALAFDVDDGTPTAFIAQSTVLAGGGHTRLWRRSSSRRDENYGEAIALGLRAGLSAADMELVQFHPTGMTWPESIAGTLVTEAVRGEGGILRNARGERFMEHYDPDRLELSTRDRVALANYTEISEGRGTDTGGVLLDISHLPKETILEKLPRMYRQMIEHQMLDISRTPIEVSPTAHYTMGGLVVDQASTSVAGLYAAGECVAGVHGANRLGGNSLVETVVFGRIAGRSAADHALSSEVSYHPRATTLEALDRLQARVGPGENLTRVLQRRLRDTLWENCGVARTGERLTRALGEIDDLTEAAKDVDVRPDAEGWRDLTQLLDLEAGLLTARATVLGALVRTETRGCHFREDYPDLDPSQQVNHVYTGASLTHSTTTPSSVPEKYRAEVEAPPKSTAGRLLE